MVRPQWVDSERRPDLWRPAFSARDINPTVICPEAKASPGIYVCGTSAAAAIRAATLRDSNHDGSAESSRRLEVMDVEDRFGRERHAEDEFETPRNWLAQVVFGTISATGWSRQRDWWFSTTPSVASTVQCRCIAGGHDLVAVKLVHVAERRVERCPANLSATRGLSRVTLSRKPKTFRNSERGCYRPLRPRCVRELGRPVDAIVTLHALYNYGRSLLTEDRKQTCSSVGSAAPGITVAASSIS